MICWCEPVYSIIYLSCTHLNVLYNDIVKTDADNYSDDNDGSDDVDGNDVDGDTDNDVDDDDDDDDMCVRYIHNECALCCVLRAGAGGWSGIVREAHKKKIV